MDKYFHKAVRLLSRDAFQKVVPKMETWEKKWHVTAL